MARSCRHQVWWWWCGGVGVVVCSSREDSRRREGRRVKCSRGRQANSAFWQCSTCMALLVGCMRFWHSHHNLFHLHQESAVSEWQAWDPNPIHSFSPPPPPSSFLISPPHILLLSPSPQHNQRCAACLECFRCGEGREGEGGEREAGEGRRRWLDGDRHGTHVGTGTLAGSLLHYYYIGQYFSFLLRQMDTL